MSQKTIRAIPTIYRGIQFRSRLEARWAVFYDSIGIAFEYEQQGFEDLSRGEAYLPDFYLPHLDLLVEVKPDITGEQDPFEKAQRFVRAGMADRILLLKGSPDFKLYDLYRRHECVEPGQFYRTNVVLDIHKHRKAYSKERRLFEDVPVEDWVLEQDFTDQYVTAVDASRSFYFGRIEYPTGIKKSGPGLRTPF